jgi:hypothetical protein
MKINLLLFCCFVLIICSTGCKKLAVGPAAATINTITTINYNSADVYVAGALTVQASNGFWQVAAYWKDGVLTLLGDTLTPSSATGIAVSGNNVYVAGFKQVNNLKTQACLWINGKEQVLSPDSSFSTATCIALQGSNVLVGGACYDLSPALGVVEYSGHGVYWMNGIPASIPNAANITSVAVSGEDVYFASYYNEPYVFAGNDTTGGGGVAAYWKDNGPVVLLGQPTTNASVSDLVGIAVSGQNVYAAGFGPANLSYFWTNGVKNELTQSNSNANAAAIALSGNDVYIGGSLTNSIGYPSAVYWKNNVPVTLSTSNINGSGYSQVNAIAVNGTDVYAAGLFYNTATSYSTVVLWVNGTAVALANGQGGGTTANAIYVVPK